MNTTVKSKFSTYSIVMMALFAAILCVSAYISIPLPNGTHITLLNFVITLIALVFPLAESFFIGLIWMLLGLVGVPVFVGGQARSGILIWHLWRFFLRLYLHRHFDSDLPWKEVQSYSLYYRCYVIRCSR